MKINIYENKKETSTKAAEKAIEILNNAIAEKGKATFVVATGASQFDFIQALIADETVDWSKTSMFHLDEYIGLPETHPASFRKYLKERFISKIENIGEVNLVDGEADDPRKECSRLNELLRERDVDVAFVGIGENGHLAFNDPPADFDIEDPFIIVELDEVCRNQQLGEGWFASLDEVPTQAISMSIKQIMKAEHIICTVPDFRKAEAVRNCFGNEDVTPLYPSSILKKHPKAYIYLDKDSGSLL